MDKTNVEVQRVITPIHPDALKLFILLRDTTETQVTAETLLDATGIDIRRASGPTGYARIRTAIRRLINEAGADWALEPRQAGVFRRRYEHKVDYAHKETRAIHRRHNRSARVLTTESIDSLTADQSRQRAILLAYHGTLASATRADAPAKFCERALDRKVSLPKLLEAIAATGAANQQDDD